MAKLTDISRGLDFYDIVDQIEAASRKAFIKTGRPIPDWFEDTNRSVAIACVEEILARGEDIEAREEA